MTGLLKAIGAGKVALIVATLTAVTALATTNASLPGAADNGQASASAAAQNGQAPSVAQGGNAADVGAQLAENKARLLSAFDQLLARLQAGGKANKHAIAALQKMIARISGGEMGLDHATLSVTSHGNSANHPTPNDHPGPP